VKRILLTGGDPAGINRRNEAVAQVESWAAATGRLKAGPIDGEGRTQ
jgi:hypothetical protein